jgi:hypothetical protein
MAPSFEPKASQATDHDGFVPQQQAARTNRRVEIDPKNGMQQAASTMVTPTSPITTRVAPTVPNTASFLPGCPLIAVPLFFAPTHNACQIPMKNLYFA